MPKVILVGQKTDQVGKTLWEIVGNLKDYGVGRLITRGTHMRYAEPSFDKIVKVETLDIPYKGGRQYNRRVEAWVERIFRGRKYPKLLQLMSSSYKPDFQLIPKDEEELWYQRLSEFKPEIKVIDPVVSLPPLLNLILKEERKAKGKAVPDVITTRVSLNLSPGNNNVRLAEEGETPTHHLNIKFGEAASPSLFENIEACRPYFENSNAWEVKKDSVMRQIKNIQNR